LEDSNILGIRQYFHETPIFWLPPIYSWDANILGFHLHFMKAQIIYEFAWFLLLQIFVYIFSIHLCIEYAPVFLVQLF
jgi:hypothetical protein